MMVANSIKIREMELPIIDLRVERSEAAKKIVNACEEYGFFKVINHGVGKNVIRKMEEESMEFFSKPSPEKQQAGPANPCGYGSKNIGFNGDVGEVEYLLLYANPLFISQTSKTISSTDPTKFSSAVNDYVEAVRGLASEILKLMAEGLGVPDTSAFSRLIRDVESDSLLRLNHYPPLKDRRDEIDYTSHASPRVGFGEHSDPQILTILRSNGVPGLQISPEDGVWVPVTPDPTAFCVNVGDVLQALTNGRFVSVRHRAMANSKKARMSMAFFCAPPLHANIICPTELIKLQKKPPLYRNFTWAEFKKAMYTLRLGESRLKLFQLHSDHDDTMEHSQVIS